MSKDWASSRASVVIVAFCCLMAAGNAFGQSGRMIYDEYDKLMKSRASVQALGTDLFGDSVNPQTGSVDIVQTDVDLPGNDTLQVRIGRRYRVGQGQDWANAGTFADWDLDIPHLHGVFSTRGGGWTISGLAANRNKRCSMFRAPPTEPSDSTGFGSFEAEDYWYGNMIYLPGVGDQEMLANDNPALQPTDGSTYPATTKNGTYLRCLATLAPTSQSGSVGEGFEAVAPDGTVYTFDHMAWLEGYPEVVKPASDGYTDHLFRREVFIFPSKVTDRFGNTVTYTWSTTNPWRLTSIVASDGRSITIHYWGATRFIDSVSDGSHTWSYTYGLGLSSVVLPDGSAWSFNMNPLAEYAIHALGATCDDLGPPDVIDLSVDMTHPSGAKLQLTVGPLLVGRSWVMRQCVHYEPSDYSLGYVLYPRVYYAIALKNRKITGPGLPAVGLQWAYGYGPDNGCWDPAYAPPPNLYLCSGSSPTTRTTTVTNPDSSTTRYVFGNRYGTNEGQLLEFDEGWTGSGSLRTTANTYASPTAGPYATWKGRSLLTRGDSQFAVANTPLKNRDIVQQARTFTWQVPSNCGSGSAQCFDVRARVVKAVKSSLPAYTRTDTTTWYDDTFHWVMNQVAQSTAGGIVASSTTFDPATAQPLTMSSFGKLQQTLTYHADGTVATVADGNSHAITLGSWKRGIPQTIQYADASSRSAVVNGFGWVTSVTDENGYTTNYTYDAMGRLASVAYPTGDSTAWNTTTQVFEPVGSAEHGIAAGHWRQTVATGNARKVTWYDALWQPLLMREYDTANESGTQRYQRFAYDHAGRNTFASYPGTSDALTTGTWTAYDALGRVLTATQDTELSPSQQVTTMAYLTGFQTQVTDPKGHATTTSYQTYDQPVADWPVLVDAPEGQRTTIARDVFGKPVTIVRGATP